MASKVVNFPQSEPAKKKQVSAPRQIELFASREGLKGCVCYLNVQSVLQDELLRLISRNDIRSIIDIRQTTYFPPPQFEHVRIADHIVRMGIKYVDHSMSATKWQVNSDNSSTVGFVEQRFAETVTGLMDEGVMLVLYDPESDRRQFLAHMRAVISQQPNFRAELHPGGRTAMAVKQEAHMPSIDPSQQWAELCKEFRIAQQRTLEAMGGAFRNGMLTSDGADDINEAHDAELAIKKRMDDFIKKYR